MSVQLNLGGLDWAVAKLRTLKDVDATPLMLSWMLIAEEDNRRGVLAGLDKDGVPMEPVTYRPKPEPGHRVTKPPKGKANAQIREALKKFRNGDRASAKVGAFRGTGSHMAGLNNNLTTAEYRLLAGPPLAPRDQFSRVITNYKADYAKLPSGNWATTFFWDDVVNAKGVAFLKYHFDGIGQKKRDLRGVRPAGMAKALDALRNWAKDIFRTHFS